MFMHGRYNDKNPAIPGEISEKVFGELQSAKRKLTNFEPFQKIQQTVFKNPELFGYPFC